MKTISLPAITLAGGWNSVEIQSYLHDYNVSSKDAWRITLRIGIHLGDVVHEAGDVFSGTPSTSLLEKMGLESHQDEKEP